MQRFVSAERRELLHRTRRTDAVACARCGMEGSSCFLRKMWSGWKVLDAREDRKGGLAGVAEAWTHLKVGGGMQWNRLERATVDMDGHQFVWASGVGNCRAG